MAEETKDEAVKTPTVDPGSCIGCGLCVQSCPEVFELGDDGKSFVKNGGACATCNCQAAIDDCPAHAISWAGEEEKAE